MPRRRRISAAVRRQITARDTQRCAYCRSPMIMGIPMVIEQALITASATCGHSAGHRSPRTPLASGAEVLWPRTEAPGVADAMIEAEGRFTEGEFGAAESGLERGDRSLDSAILGQVTNESLGASDGQRLFPNIDVLYAAIDEAERAHTAGETP